jgi:hypothetical protein
MEVSIQAVLLDCGCLRYFVAAVYSGGFVFARLFLHLTLGREIEGNEGSRVIARERVRVTQIILRAAP